MNDTSEKVALGFAVTGGVVLVLLIAALFGLYGAWAAAYVGVHLWAWFVVPVFGLPMLTLPQAFGLSLLCHYWTWQHFSQHTKDERPLSERVSELAGLVIMPWFVLLMGWICKAYFMGA